MAKPEACPKHHDLDHHPVAAPGPADPPFLASLVWQRGRAVGPVQRLAAQEPPLFCWICGRPLGQGEDFGRWRLRAVRTSSAWIFELRPICPGHYRDEAA